MNQITIAGRLGNDPDVRFTSSGLKVTSFRVATNSRKAGKEETIWYKVTIWGDQFEKMIPHIKKGTGLIITGELGKPEIYNDREGRPQISLNVTAFQISFSPFGSGTTKSPSESTRSSDFPDSEAFSHESSGQGAINEEQFSDEEIPF